MAGDLSFIRIRGAREHNLKAVSLDIPRDRLIVITGLSGSGKSSLAFDTLYAEGQRRYVESLSAYARQFLEQLQKPDVESIEGLPPTISIEQRSGVSNPRSTVATTTEIYDYLRLLFARVGEPYCHKCGKPIRQQTPPEMVDQVMRLSPGGRILVLAPLVRGRKGEHKDVLQRAKRDGFVRVRVDGGVHDFMSVPELDKRRKHSIEAVVDRLVMSPVIRTRLADSVETALRFGEGLVVVSHEGKPGKWTDVVFSSIYACPDCGVSYGELSPRMFSFNSPYGACPTCGGLGTKMELDADLIIPNPRASIEDGAIEAWRKGGRRMAIYYHRLLRRFCHDFAVSPSTAFQDLGENERRLLMHGTTGEDEERLGHYFEGVVPNLMRRFERTESEFVKRRILSYMSELPCPACNGARLRPEMLAVRIREKSILDVTRFTVDQALAFFGGLALPPEKSKIAQPILREIRARLQFMTDVGLDYLSLDRKSGTLAGGEAQRIRLATQVGSGLVGVCYVLDEPTIGLHPRDNSRLITTLQKLRDIGNTVIVVEHDEETIRAADELIDLGPGAGVHGGHLVYQGPVDKVGACDGSLTGKYLTGAMSVPVPKTRRPVDGEKILLVKGARENNLKSINVRIPLGLFVAVTGVSGSGKSTLVNEVLFKALMRKLMGGKEKPGAHDRVVGTDLLDKVIEIDQSPIGRTPRSNAATYTGAFDLIRALFAKIPEAKIRGYKPGRFSFNVKGGRCEACQGQGTKIIEMHFLPDVYVLCDACKGLRYNHETLEVRYKGETIADVLDMSVEEALDFFKHFPQLKRILRTMEDVGLGYVRIGQSSTTLSGGEAQRVKLATELSREATGNTLYILDEPTTGLHFADTSTLLDVLHRLVERGNTVLVIEHNLDVVKTADYLIDLGPEGGEAGGTVVATGTPEAVAAHATSYTGHYLRKVLREGTPAGNSGSAPGDTRRAPAPSAVNP
ncbi:MAG: excinuclease ABC subunit UvrA [Planctomycetota bacterium]